jgi:hypothetical protein
MARKKNVEEPAPKLTAVPKRKAPRATKPKSSNTEVAGPLGPSYEEIAEAAYLRFLSRGGDHGSDFDDWVEAERELTRRRGYLKAV